MNQEQLVTALRSQDPGAMSELVTTFGDRLFRSACLLCGNETEAQDLVQETFLEAIRSIHRFQGRSTIYTWLHAILLNLARRSRRHRQRLVYDDELISREISPANENPDASDIGTAASALGHALARLSEVHREVIVLRYFEELKIHEIAACLVISAGTVKSRLHYAIEEMQKLLPGEMNLFGVSDTKEIQRP
jgi:RNA polymerase sigma-70 factor (ECF subfamily)